MITSYTATVSLDDLAPASPARMAATQSHDPTATTEPADYEPAPQTIWDAAANASAAVREALKADGIPLGGVQISYITLALGGTEDTAKAWASLGYGALAVFSGGPLDRQEHPAPPISLIPDGPLPRTARMEPGGFYELSEILWAEGKYCFSWVPNPLPAIEWL